MSERSERVDLAVRLAIESGGARGEPFSVPVLGRSMWPLLRPGDRALFSPPRSPWRKGAVLLYRQDAAPDATPVSRLIVHRFIGLAPDGRLRLRGDFTLAEDAPVSPEAILGELCAIERNGQRRRARLLGGAVAGATLAALARHRPGTLRALAGSLSRAARAADAAWTSRLVRPLRRLGAPGFEIGRAGPADAERLELHDRARGRKPAEYRSLLTEGAPEGLCLIASHARTKAVVGSTHLLYEPEWAERFCLSGAWLHDTYVEHAYRGLGLGRRLTARALAESLAADGSCRVLVAIETANRRSRALHENLGFRPCREMGEHLVLAWEQRSGKSG